MRLLPTFVLLALLLHAPAAAAPADGETLARRLLNSQGCKACHQIGGEGAAFAPALDKVGGRLTADQLRSALVNPQKHHAGGRIGDFSHLQGNEIDALVSFLGERQ